MTDAWDGRPQEPERDGWHWVGNTVGISDPYPMLWGADGRMWDTGDGWEWPDSRRIREGKRYLGPCLTPAEVAAREAQARRDGWIAARDAIAEALGDSAAWANIMAMEPDDAG